MPNISEYNPNIPSIRPSETGVEAAAMTARHINATSSEVAASEERTGQVLGGGLKNALDATIAYEDHKEIAAGAATSMRMFSNQQEGMDAATKNIPLDDPLYGQKVEASLKQWREQQFEPAMQDWLNSGQFNTEKSRDWAEHFVETSRQHFYAQSNAAISSAAGIGVHNAARSSLNEAVNTALNNPAAVDALIDNYKHTISGLIESSPVKGIDSAKIQQEEYQRAIPQIVRAGAYGVIKNSPDPERAAAAYSSKYAEWVDVSEAAMMGRSAATMNRMNEAEARRARVETDYVNKQNFNNAADKLEVDTIPIKPGDPPRLPADYWERVKTIAAQPGVDPARLRALITNGEAITNKLGKPEPLGPVSHQTTIDLLNQLRSGQMPDTSPIYKAYSDNKLNNADLNFMISNFNEMKTPEGERLDKDRDLFFKRYSLQIDPSMGENGDKLYGAEMYARRLEADARKNGDDPNLVYTPGSKYFIGTPEMINKFKQGNLQQQIIPPTPAKEIPKGYPPTSQFDADRNRWFVIQNGKKFWVDSTAAEAPQVPLR